MICTLVLRYRQALLLVGFSLFLLLAACGPVSEDVRIYSLDPPTVANAFDQPPLRGTLMVNPPASESVYADRRLAWRDLDDPLRLHQMNRRLWSLTPPRMVQQQLLNCLANRRIADHVVPPGVPARVDYSLNGTLERFEAEVRDGAAEIVMVVELYLTQRHDRRIALQRRFTYRVPISEAKVEAMVRGYSSALNHLCAEASQALAAEAR